MLIRRARIVLALDSSGGEQQPDDLVAAQNGVSRQTVHNVRKDFLERGAGSFLERKRRAEPPVAPKADGEYEAHLIALSRTDPPDGYARWTLRLLADKSVELGYIGSVSAMTVGRVLKKTSSGLT
ncbi:MAG: helix-turn-helix domain-containing protein [Coriobacteriales bacterium]|nr:helix-turn-helix domain-containing protein [Coriobacteriales bacterium]